MEKACLTAYFTVNLSELLEFLITFSALNYHLPQTIMHAAYIMHVHMVSLVIVFPKEACLLPVLFSFSHYYFCDFFS